MIRLRQTIELNRKVSDIREILESIFEENRLLRLRKEACFGGMRLTGHISSPTTAYLRPNTLRAGGTGGLLAELEVGEENSTLSTKPGFMLWLIVVQYVLINLLLIVMWLLNNAPWFVIFFGMLFTSYWICFYLREMRIVNEILQRHLLHLNLLAKK